MRKIVSAGPGLVVLAAGVVLVMSVPTMVRRVEASRTAAVVQVARQALDEEPILERLNAAVRAVGEAVTPSVVHIDVMEGSGRRSWRGASGSGWVYDLAGHVVTNAHVVQGYESVSVQFHDGRVASAEVVDADPQTDVAVLRVSGGGSADLVPARRASGERVRVGDRVFAFGSPFGFKFSMSEGIVSGLGRTTRGGMSLTGITNYIQTDAAVNPGNSGGPLVDVRGRVVGMNVAIATAQEGGGEEEGIGGQSAGISFAIPLAVVESRVEAMIRGSVVVPGFLGVEPEGMTEFGEDGLLGVGLRIRRVQPGLAAERGGMLAGDIVTAIEGQAVTEWSVFRSIIAGSTAGTRLGVTVWREGREERLMVEVGSPPREFVAEQLSRMMMQQVGVVLGPSGDGVEGEGVMVRGVAPWAEAAMSGLRAGMRVVAINGRTMEGANWVEALEALREEGIFRGRGVTLRVRPEDGSDAEAVGVELRARRR